MKLLKWVTAVLGILSLVILLYGCIKMMRFENKLPHVNVDIPGVTVETVKNSADWVFVQRIVIVSSSIFFGSIIGFVTLGWKLKKGLIKHF